jgi:hypothetical protein
MISDRFPRLSDNKPVFIEVSDFSGGSNSLFSETRIKETEAVESTNLMLKEDGVWAKRWGTAAYGGVTFTNTPDGFTEYLKSDGTRELIVIADGKFWVVDPAAETKTEVAGATFTAGYPCDFAQLGGYLYICNGQDVLARYNGTSLAVYAALGTPVWGATPITRGAGLSAGSYSYFYRVSAVNAVGETLAAAAETITVDKLRDDWSAADETLTLAWAAVVGALQYVIYMSDTSGYEVMLAQVATNSYVDDGSDSLNGYIEPPTDDTTTGPLFASIAVSGNRLWGTADPSNTQKVYWSGTGVNLGNFSPAYDGGWLNLEKGGRNETVTVEDYQGEAHVFCKTAEGRGSIWKVVLTSTTTASQTIIIPVPVKLITAKGTPATRSTVHVENDLYFLNEAGVHVLGDEVGVLNRLRTNELSAKIRPFISSMYKSSLDKACAYYYDGKVFFSVPTESGAPNRVIYYDTELKAWVAHWTIGVSQFGEFTDTNGNTHLLGIQGNKLIEFSPNYGGDSGTAFSWKYTSPRFLVSKNWGQFGKIKRAYIRLKDALGAPVLTFTGTGKKDSTATLATASIGQGISDTGLGWDALGSVMLGDTSGSPTTYALQSLIRYFYPRKLVRDIQWTLTGSKLNDRATITGLMAEGALIDTGKPEEWKL